MKRIKRAKKEREEISYGTGRERERSTTKGSTNERDLQQVRIG